LKNQWQGYDRYPNNEIFEFGRRDFQALSDILGDKPYFLGDKPTSWDAGIYSLLTNAIDFPTESPLKEIGRSFENIVAYHDRMKEKYWGLDFDSTQVPSSDTEIQLLSLVVNNSNFVNFKNSVKKLRKKAS
jgi:hypothetical protein